MSTPGRAPYRLSINTSNSMRGFEDCSIPHSGWHTPLSAQDQRRPSLTYSALSEPSPSSLPTTPGYRFSSTHDSVPLYFGDAQCSARSFNCMRDVPMGRNFQHPGLTSLDMMAGEDARLHMGMSMSPACDSFNTSFSSTSTDSWDHSQHSGLQQLTQPMSFRPSSYVSMDGLSENDHNRSMNSDDVMQQQMLQAGAGASFDGMTGPNMFNPGQLVVPSEVQDPDTYSYSQQLESSVTSPIDQATMHSASFDSFPAFGQWPHMDSSVSPVHEYSLPEDSLAMRAKLGSPVRNIDMVEYPDINTHDVTTPKRSRCRTRASVSKRCRAGAHQLVKNFFGLDVAIDPKTMKMDMETGVISKKNTNVETKRWQCSVEGCNSRSARKEHLRRHELSHQPEKQFHCKLPKCDKAITRSDNLIQHLMTHARPPKPGKRNNHHSSRRIEQMVLDTMTDRKLADRTITNLRKAIERENVKWPQSNSEDMAWNGNDDDDVVDALA